MTQKFNLTNLTRSWWVYLVIGLPLVPIVLAGQASAAPDLSRGNNSGDTAVSAVGQCRQYGGQSGNACRPTPGATPNTTPIPTPVDNCSITSVGLTPITELRRGDYNNFPGGLYPGSNVPSGNHLSVGLAAGQAVQPRNQQGQPSNTGKIVLLSIGMSNVKQEFGKFIRIVDRQSNPKLVLVNGAQGSYDAPEIANVNSDYWDIVDQRLDSRNVTREQVQVIWLKEAIAGEDDQFPLDAQELKNYLRSTVLILENRFPNLEAVYFSSRIYGGYGVPSSASKEPWAYQSAFAVKWLIEDQINGSDPALAYTNTPWLGWGPYMWADGLEPREDGLTWSCSDFVEDGTHPSASGEAKVAAALLDFFETSPTTQWFTDSFSE